MSEWMPIESAPRDGTRIAIRFASGHEEEASWRTTYGGEWHVKAYVHLPWHNQAGITHWMPLPAPPTGAPQ